MNVPENALWYHASSSDSESWHGGFNTREGAIAEGRTEYGGDVFHVVWATNPPVKLSDWVQDGAELLDRANESLFDSDRVISEHDDGMNIFEARHSHQEVDLTARIKRACDEWQAAWGLTFTVRTFLAMGSPEAVPALEPVT